MRIEQQHVQDLSSAALVGADMRQYCCKRVGPSVGRHVKAVAGVSCMTGSLQSEQRSCCGRTVELCWGS